MIKKIKKHWRDIAAFVSLLLLTSISVYEKYQAGVLTGFLILFVFFSYERIKRIIVELSIKKIFGVEFGEIEREEIVEGLKSELMAQGTSLNESEIENIADIALNQIHGVAYKGRYYEEMVYYALKDLKENVTGAVWKLSHLDFLVYIGDTQVIGIEAIYSDQRYLDTNKLKRVRQSVESINKTDNFAGFVLVTNSEVKDSDMEILIGSSPSITLIDKTISPSGVLSRLSEYFKNVKQQISNKEN